MAVITYSASILILKQLLLVNNKIKNGRHVKRIFPFKKPMFENNEEGLKAEKTAKSES